MSKKYLEDYLDSENKLILQKTRLYLSDASEITLSLVMTYKYKPESEK